ncbi:MAG: hypothetical protein Kow0075_14590 [Salibacteraceae bacterium]
MTINHPATFVRRECYDRLGLFDTNYRCAMDYEWLLRAYLAGAKFHYLDKTLVNMSMEGLSDSQWMLGCREVRMAKLKHGIHPAKAWLWFLRQSAAIAIVKAMSSSPLEGVLRIYRKNFARVRKV